MRRIKFMLRPRSRNEQFGRGFSTWSVLCALVASCLVSAIPSHAQTLSTIFHFNGTDGSHPVGPLVQGFDGNLYGATIVGGTNNEGTLFKITTKGILTSLFTFCATIPCTTGQQPFVGSALGRDGNLYGTTQFGAGGGGGTVFKFTPSGKLTTLYTFSCVTGVGCPEGTGPSGLIQATDGNFYGTTANGGSGQYASGTVFRITPSGVLSTLYTFCQQGSPCVDGAAPNGVIQATDGILYGTTSNGGGPNNGGTVFKITLEGTLITLHTFCTQAGCPDGYQPRAGLIQASDGNLYGTTASTVFRITTTGELTTLYTFSSCGNGCPDGYGPLAAMIQATDGNLYGTTTQGGAFNRGTIFKITTGGTLTTLYSFSSAGQAGPLFQATDGNLYGTESSLGGKGNIFKLNMGLGPFVETLPTSGTVGAKAVILGTNLTGATAVDFNGTPATFTVVSATEIKTSVPSGATTGTVTVTTPGGTLKSNLSFQVQ